jgi:hypothetical protein
MEKPEPTYFDFKDKRNNRQLCNNNLVLTSINNNNKSEFYKNINKNALKRLLEYSNIDFNYFWEKCKKDDDYSRCSILYISINASRQGMKDEQMQIELCNNISKKFGIYINKLNVDAIRPTKDGKIYNKDINTELIAKDECLKSFDAEITGKLNGFISAKVCFTNGGNQDNSFEEMDRLADWWNNYMKDDDYMLFIIIDTDLIKKMNTIKEKYNHVKNVKIFNHYEFQEYLISKYYIEVIKDNLIE